MDDSVQRVAIYIDDRRQIDMDADLFALFSDLFTKLVNKLHILDGAKR